MEYRPVKSNYLVQKFGENLACTKTDSGGKAIYPFQVLRASYPGSCPAGSTKLYPALGLKGHRGEDWGLFLNEPLYHAADFRGWLKLGYGTVGGIYVEVVSNEPIREHSCPDQNGATVKHYVKRYYGHLNKAIGLSHSNVDIGKLIGYGGKTGAATGPHCHTQKNWCDKEGNTIHRENGYGGAIDTTLEQKNEFVLDFIQEFKEEQLSILDRLRKVVLDLQMSLKKT